MGTAKHDCNESFYEAVAELEGVILQHKRESVSKTISVDCDYLESILLRIRLAHARSVDTLADLCRNAMDVIIECESNAEL